MDWQKAKRDLLLALSSHFLYKIAGYVILTILTRYLAKDEMGEFFFAAALASFFVLITELGTGNYVIREVARHPEKSLQRFSEVVSIRLPLFALYFLTLNVLTLIAKPDLIWVVLLTSVYVLLEEFYTSFGGLFIGLKRVAYNVISGVSSRVLLIILILTAVAYKGSLAAIITCYILANVFLVGASFIILWLKVGRLRLSWNPDSALRILRMSFPFFLLTALGLIHFKVDTLMLGFIKSYPDVATYEAAYKLFEASRFLILPLSMIFYPIYSEMAVRQDWQEIKILLEKMLLAVGLLGSVIALVVILTAGFIIPFVFGSKYSDSISVLRILYLSVPVLYIATVNTTLAKSINLERKAVSIMLTCVLINVVLNGVTIPLWGARGAAWTTLISEAFLAVWLVKLNFTELRILSAREEVSVLEKKLDHV